MRRRGEELFSPSNLGGEDSGSIYSWGGERERVRNGLGVGDSGPTRNRYVDLGRIDVREGERSKAFEMGLA